MKKCCEKQRKGFAKEILDMLDEVVRGTPSLQDFIYPIKGSIREVRDKRGGKKDRAIDLRGVK